MTTPARMDIHISSIPIELRNQSKWICWRWETRKGKLTKPPYDYKTNKYAKSNDPDTWGDFEAAYQAMKKAKYDGVGFMLSFDDPYSGIDWDDCYDGQTINPDIHKAILAFNSYTEFSPSGKGLKTLVKGKLPGPGHHGATIGVFDSVRYFCITGHRYEEVSPNIEDRQLELNAFYAKHWGPQEERPETYGIPYTDDEIIQRALSSNDGGKFARLWSGDISDYPSASEADLALCSKLAFWTNGDMDRVNALFRCSGLMRDKWERDDYRQKTFDRTLQTFSSGYSGHNGLNGHNGQSGQDGLNGYEHFSTDINGHQRTTDGQPTDINGQKGTERTQRTKRTEKCQPSEDDLKNAVKAWILMDKRTFRIQDVYNDLDIRNRQQKKNVSDYLARFCLEGLIERINGQRGVFSYNNRECTYIDFLSTSNSLSCGTRTLILPLGLESLNIQVLPSNIIVIAGESNAGKTSVLLNIVHDNLKSLSPEGIYKTAKYFTSEMGPQEMHTRVAAFQKPLSLWSSMHAIERTSNFHQVLDPDGLNLIDFMEVHNEFYLVGEWIRKIHEVLKSGICVIALQKKSGTDFGRSGEISLEKPRLYLSISEVVKGYSSCKIVKAKNYTGDRNPNGLEKDFRITCGGSKLEELTGWRYVTRSERQKVNAQYELMAKQEANEWVENSLPGDETAYEFYVDGDTKRVTIRQVRQWRNAFKGLDVDAVLEEIAYDSFEKPFLTKNWFWQVSGILGKKHKNITE